MSHILIPVMSRIQEDDAPQVRKNGILTLTGQLHHVGHVHFCFFSQ